MTSYDILKIGHSFLGLLLFFGVSVHTWMLWRGHKAGDPEKLKKKLNRTAFITIPVMSIVLLSLPVTGWFLVDKGNWPLSQTWLLLSSLLFIALIVLTTLLSGRIYTWRALKGAPAPKLLGYLSFFYVVIFLAIFVAIFVMMGAKPV